MSSGPSDIVGRWTSHELGMKVASGRPGPADVVAAHKWFNIAVARGCRMVADFRSELAREMSPEEIAAAQRACS
jgi:hypothetical protein